MLFQRNLTIYALNIFNHKKMTDKHKIKLKKWKIKHFFCYLKEGNVFKHIIFFVILIIRIIIFYIYNLYIILKIYLLYIILFF